MVWKAKWIVVAILGLIPWLSFGSIPDFSGALAYEQLVAQCDFGPRPPGSEAHDECANWLIATMRLYADDVERQDFAHQFELTGKTENLVNIIARFQPEFRDRVVIGAHWDTRPIAEFDPDSAKQDTPILGANDGASGVAVILELARILSENPPPVGIDLVLFDGEDSGLHEEMDTWCIGSRYYGKHLTGELPRWGIVLDMIGEKDASYSIELYSLQLAPRLTKSLWRLAGELHLSQFVPSGGPVVWDDHVMLNRYGIPSVDIIDFDYPYWHSTEDTPDKCSPESLGAVGILLVNWIYSGARVSP